MVSESLVKEVLPLAYKGRGGAQGEGKVREWWNLPGGRRLIVTTDRLSAFDRVLTAVPFKGQVLNELSAFWFRQTADIVPNHLESTPDPNCAIVREAEPLPVEVIVRGYITGVTSTALWRRYELGERTIYGQHFPEGLRKNEKLPVPVITPTTKGGPTGHDERLDLDEVVTRGWMAAALWDQIKQAALALFQRGTEIAARAGLILVDTKYEFGLDAEGKLVLIDEVHTPDSSRFWLASSYQQRFEAGLEPECFDKEFVRLEYARTGYRGDGEPPVMPDELWVRTSLLYQESFERITGMPFIPASYPVEPRIQAVLKSEGLL
ncbi:MAG: phosphoribosylaminoimidazolesuccinocarboxamide synthase [Spirochaetaceae bacterium]|nr:phosphoribosylaminoimidazolesuccinocarboxamide synthase [Spirochaetaceae bacterium]